MLSAGARLKSQSGYRCYQRLSDGRDTLVRPDLLRWRNCPLEYQRRHIRTHHNPPIDTYVLNKHEHLKYIQTERSTSTTNTPTARQT